MRKKLSILIPCYNEEKTIAQVIDGFKCALNKLKTTYDTELIVFNNCSTDDSLKIIQKSDVKYFNVYSPGKGNVVREMFRKVSADIYVMVDADCTYSPYDIEKLIEPIEDGADMVIGDRLSSTYYTENKRPFHNFGNKYVKKLINQQYKSDISDVMTGYRAFSKRFVKCMPVMSKGFQIETEMTIFALKNNFDVRSVPISYKDRPDGSSSKLNTYKDGIKVLWLIYKQDFLDHPLKTFSLFGAIITIYGLFTNLFLAFFGILLIFSGIVGSFLSHYFNKSEQYYIKSIINQTEEKNNE